MEICRQDIFIASCGMHHFYEQECHVYECVVPRVLQWPQALWWICLGSSHIDSLIWATCRCWLFTNKIGCRLCQTITVSNFVIGIVYYWFILYNLVILVILWIFDIATNMDIQTLSGLMDLNVNYVEDISYTSIYVTGRALFVIGEIMFYLDSLTLDVIKWRLYEKSRFNKLFEMDLH